MVISLTNTTQRLQEYANRTSINTNHLACTWRVEMKKEDSIKEEGGNERKRSRNQERNTVAIRNQICNQTCEKYIRLISSDCAEDDFPLI